MKKLLVIIMLIFSLLFLQACDLVLSNESSELKALRAKYQTFTKTDVSNTQNFYDLMNDFTFNEQSSVFKVMKMERSIIPFQPNLEYGHALLFTQDLHKFYLFTLYELVEEQSRWINYYAYDIYGDEFNVTVEFASPEDHLAVISIPRNFKVYEHVEIATEMPFPGELLVSLGHQHPIANTQRLGVYMTDENEHFISLTTGVFAKGRAVFNLERKLIGLEIEQIDDQVLIFDFTKIQHFLDQYQNQ